MAKSKKKPPTHKIYVNVGGPEDSYKQEIGAAWAHEEGGGFNMVFNSFPVSGRCVAFLAKNKKTEESKSE